MDFTYTLIKSKRKTISLEVRGDELIVRAPNRTTKREADEFVRKHEAWIVKKREQIAARKAMERAVPRLSEEELHVLAQMAKKVIPERVAYYARIMGAHYGRITLRCQKTRWGSCSAKKNLNFNILELCHLFEMNHSARFYERVYAVYPEYDRWNGWLKKNGDLIMARAGYR